MSDNAIVTVRRSSRHRRCSEPFGPWFHNLVIQPGELYALLALPPGSEVGNAGWWHAVACRECATNEGHGALFEARESGGAA